MKEIEFKFRKCQYWVCMYVPIKASLRSFVEFLLKFGPFSPKIDKECQFFDKLTCIHTRYWQFLNLNSISFNFCSYTFFPIKALLRSFLEFLLKFGPFFPQKLILIIIFLEQKLLEIDFKFRKCQNRVYMYVSLPKKLCTCQFLGKTWSIFQHIQQKFNKTP